MTFISYAQNFEDVMLWRALKHVETGFYVDLGAWSPDQDSVTRALYDLGWHGINIEPNPEFNEQLNKRRPRDINLKVAIGETEGFLTMNFLTNPGLSTLDDAIAEQHRAAGWVVTREQVQVKPLARLWHDYVPAGQEVHFLKVDVEGFEEPALKGNDWSRYRPWVVVVEATLPMSQVESYHSWEQILLDAGYQFAYADGLNRFYVSDEHAELLPAFRYPPNVFDGFLLARQQEAESRAIEALAKQVELQSQVDQLNGQAYHWWQQATQLELERNALRSSWSWRITAPLRFIVRLIIQPVSIARLAANHVIHRTIESAQRPLSRLMSIVLRRPQLAYRINQVLMGYPALYRQLQRVAVRSGLLTVGQANVAHTAQQNGFVPNTGQRSLLARAVVSLLKNKTLVSSVHAALKPFPKLHAKAIRRVTGLVSSVAQPIWLPASSRSLGLAVEQEPAQLLLDVTGLIQEDAGTGVQRLVRSLLLELIANPPNRFVVRPVFATLGEQGYRYAGERVRQLYDIGEEASGVMDLRRGDVFVGLDLQHALVIQNQLFFQTVRSLGVRVFFVVYDLLPVRHPNYFRPEMEFLHRDWLKVVACSDGALCISNTVANDLRAWIDQNDLAPISKVSIHQFALGSEFPAIDSNASAVPDAPDILAMPRLRPAFLLVGTIEPRKGHALVLAAFEHLWKEGVDLDLIIVGKSGWMMDDLISGLRGHPESGQHLHWLENANDDVLALAYRNTTCLIAASECEGYGLPLVEAARYQLPIIARDIDPFREIADGSAYFFSPTSTPRELADCLQRWLTLHRNGESPRSDGIRQVTWSQSAQDLIECIDPVLEQYLFGGSDRRDGDTSVERVLSGIRRELSSYRERVQ